MFGRDATRNAVSPEKNPPLDWYVKGGAKKVVGDKVVETHQEGRGILWQAQLGSNTFGDPVVAGGLVWVGTNNGHPRDPKHKGDASVLMCFRERDGVFLWQYVSPRIPGNIHRDWSESGINCSPLVEGDRLWFTTTRCETLCLDIGPLKRGEGDPRIVWKVDMTKELGVFPLGTIMTIVHTCSPAGYREFLYVITGNGRDASREKIPAPEAPSLICFEKETGKVVWKDNSPGKDILDGQWGSPLAGEIGGRAQVIAPFGDGWLRSFDPRTGKPLWQFDTNPKEAKYSTGGKGERNYLLTAPVLYEGKIYIANGQQPEHGDGKGWLHCIDPTKSGDVSPQLADGKPNPNTAAVWTYGPGDLVKGDGMRRTESNLLVGDGLVIAPTLAGYIHCVDARTGRPIWTHDTMVNVMTSPLAVDGKVFLATDEGDVLIFALARRWELLRKIDVGAGWVNASPVYANGVLYVTRRDTLYAIGRTR